jgi:hypothetical protein
LNILLARGFFRLGRQMQQIERRSTTLGEFAQ